MTEGIHPTAQHPIVESVGWKLQGTMDHCSLPQTLSELLKFPCVSTAAHAAKEAASAARKTELNRSRQRNIEVVDSIKPHRTLWGIYC